MADLKGKVGIVTGGGSGIGKATALAMARAGASLVIGSRDASKSEGVVLAIRQAGGKAVFQATDVSKPAEVKALVERAVKDHFGVRTGGRSRWGIIDFAEEVALGILAHSGIPKKTGQIGCSVHTYTISIMTSFIKICLAASRRRARGSARLRLAAKRNRRE